MAKDITDVFVIILIFIALLTVGAGLVRTSTSTSDVANETVTNLTNSTARALDNDRLVSGSIVLLNATMNNTIPTSNYSVDLNLGRLVLTTDSNFEGEDGLISYSIRAQVEGVSAIVVGLIILVVAIVFMRIRVKDMKGKGR